MMSSPVTVIVVVPVSGIISLVIVLGKVTCAAVGLSTNGAIVKNNKNSNNKLMTGAIVTGKRPSASFCG